ncbi:MAG: cytidylate kinase-like family protein [Coriobacteriales bacterium]|jgi:cytidylate kinase|nr:cytidylate kinase-like family protein [Coriobacteriales bacterium]
MTKQIITISRQYGSGGREVGHRVADQLGYAYYDKKLIQRIAKLGDVDVDFVNANGEGLMGKLSTILSHLGAEGNDEGSLPLPDRLFLIESRTVKQIANEGPCVIIGHCADHFLEDRDDVLNVFIYAGWDSRVQRVMKRNDLNEPDSIHRIKRIDRNRKSFYEQYTDRHWGQSTNYDISLSSSCFGIEDAATIISHIAKNIYLPYRHPGIP